MMITFVPNKTVIPLVFCFVQQEEIIRNHNSINTRKLAVLSKLGLIRKLPTYIESTTSASEHETKVEIDGSTVKNSDTQATMNVSTDMRSVFSYPHNPNFAWDATDKIFPWVMVAIVSIASPAAVILNILVIAAVRSRKELQKNSNILLSSMAAADILVGAINMPLSATVDFVISRQVFNDYICTVHLVNVYLMYALTACTLYHLTFIAWERYQAIRNCYENKANLFFFFFFFFFI